MTPAAFQELVLTRRSVFPETFTGQAISREALTQILEAAHAAPTHKHTQPWRFLVLHSDEARQNLADTQSGWYKNTMTGDKFSEKKYDKMRSRPVKSGAVIAIIMQRDASASVPEWEELAAVSMAVQNLWLAAHAQGLGGYWGSPGFIKSDDCRNMLELAEGQQCLGFFYLGYHKMPVMYPQQRDALETKVSWK
jgi:nitroreductase